MSLYFESPEFRHAVMLIAASPPVQNDPLLLERQNAAKALIAACTEFDALRAMPTRKQLTRQQQVEHAQAMSEVTAKVERLMGRLWQICAAPAETPTAN